MITTISYNQHEIIYNIQKLYIPDGIELDPTFSQGNFYKPDYIKTPKLKFDLFPKTLNVIKASAENLPLGKDSINSIMFDPPFIVGHATPDKITGKIGKRFGSFKNIKSLWEWYNLCIIEFYRILKPSGFLVFKCQDTVSSGKNWYSHCYIYNIAISKGLDAIDLFILLAKTRMIGYNQGIQKHARKFHSYFWVFKKGKAYENKGGRQRYTNGNGWGIDRKNSV